MEIVECSFLIPIRRDSNLSDGQEHPAEAWRWLLDELFLQFGGATVAPGLYEGLYTDPDTGERVGDQCRKYVIAIPEARLDLLRALLSDACVCFAQKCIYLSVAGKVEFVEGTGHAQE